MRTRLTTILPGILLAAAACSGGASSGDDTPDAAGLVDADPAGWQTLVSSTWTIPTGEQYLCERVTIEEEVWLRAFQSDNPLGSHHAVLTIDPDGGAGPDGQFDCAADTNFTTMIYGSAPGTQPVTFPAGVGMRVPAGAQLNLNLHLYNVQPGGDLTGTTTVYFQPVPPEEVAQVEEAEVVLMGPATFSVPPGTGQEVSGGCTQTAPVTLFMTQPHMHQLGVHARIVAERAAGDVVLHEGAYAFDEQRLYPIDPVAMAQGDRVAITCTYDNDTGTTVPFGDSSDQEMCFATTYRYPALGGGTFGIVCPF
jgi:hypothetical protein